MIMIKEKIEAIPVIAGEIQGWLEKKYKLFYHFGKSFFCAKLQILKLFLEKLFPQENLEIYAHLNICLHLARWRGEKSGDFFYLGKPLVQKE